MKPMILLIASQVPDSGNLFGYLIGAAIALLILVYLIYSLIKPEKF